MWQLNNDILNNLAIWWFEISDIPNGEIVNITQTSWKMEHICQNNCAIQLDVTFFPWLQHCMTKKSCQNITVSDSSFYKKQFRNRSKNPCKHVHWQYVKGHATIDLLQSCWGDMVASFVATNLYQIYELWVSISIS